MSKYNTYRSNAAEAPIMRKWFMRAAILSLLAHAALFFYFRSTKLERFTSYTERLVPRAFNIGHAEIDAKLLKDDEEKQSEPKKVEPDAKPMQPLPDEKESFEKMLSEARVKPSAPEEVKPIVNEKPKVEATNLQALAQAKDQKPAIEHELDAVRDQLIRDKPKVSNQSFLNLAEATKKKTGGATGATSRNFSNLDALLGAGQLRGPVAPLNLPGGALFAFNSANILPQAEEMLGKLGKLIEKNPHATFEVEGYADSIGETSPDGHAYNLALSQQRADAVKEYLVTRFHIEPARIQSHGYGSTKYIVPPTGDADAEAQNRRVEIVIHTSL
jgi:outer membrane protein OmpA-like peptidoglycan-associated protein